MADVKDENGRKERFFLFYDGESVSGKVNITLHRYKSGYSRFDILSTYIFVGYEKDLGKPVLKGGCEKIGSKVKTNTPSIFFVLLSSILFLFSSFFQGIKKGNKSCSIEFHELKIENLTYFQENR